VLTSPVEIVHAALAAGYKVLVIEHPRSRRWLLTLQDSAGAISLLIAQSRPLIGATDVLDLADLVRVRRVASGILWAYDGRINPAAQRTSAEIGARATIYIVSQAGMCIGIGDQNMQRCAAQSCVLAHYRGLTDMLS
jgi:hypothetical protein